MQAVVDLHDIENERMKLLERKDHLGVKKVGIQDKLRALKNEIKRRGRMPQAEYNRMLHEQERLSKAITEVEEELVQIKIKLRGLHGVEVEVFANSAITVELIKMRQHYQEFAADLTRIAAMRHLAAEFALKLTQLIRDDLRRPPISLADEDLTRVKINGEPQENHEQEIKPIPDILK